MGHEVAFKTVPVVMGGMRPKTLDLPYVATLEQPTNVFRVQDKAAALEAEMGKA